jgi:D-3-phosphoglycerate dehydrogenase
MAKVLIADALSPRAVDVFTRRGVDVETRTGLKPAELATIIGGFDGLAVRSATKVTEAVLRSAGRLRVVGRAGIGVDNIDVPAATSRGVVVMNTPFGNAITTAEHAIALILALARRIPAADRSTQAGRWEKNRFLGVELTNKTLGVIGCGNIGSIVADRALGLRMKVVAYDPYLTLERAQAIGVEKVEIDTLLARADVITLHTPLTDATRHILDAAALAKCRPGVRIVNCARGGLIDETALAAALDSGHVAGAALDVFVTEPATSHPLFGRDDVICTPHLGASTTEAQENVAIQVAEQICDFLLDGAIVNAVNMPSVSGEEAVKLAPYLRLVRNLGSFLGQRLETAPKRVTIAYQGGAAALNARPLTAALLMGLLGSRLESVNMVNAPVIARERGIVLDETRRETASDYQNLISVAVEDGERRRSASGSVFGEDKPRLVAVDDIPIEAEFGAQMLYVRNADKPGFIGNLGRMLGDAGINIASLNLGRTAPGADAICLVQVDQALDEAMLARVRAIPLVKKARALSF